jgi:hypothetical protein
VDIAGVTSQLTALTFIQTTGVSVYNIYRFRIAAKNKYGFGAFGLPGSILAAIPPSPITTVTTTR